MQRSSAKAKGKTLERFIVARIKEAFNFEDDDIRTAIGSENGLDIKITRRSAAKFPFGIECKNRETFTSIYNHYSQAATNSDGLIPLVVIKMNRQKPLAILDFEHFLTLVSK